jgi:hypothetical protein
MKGTLPEVRRLATCRADRSPSRAWSIASMSSCRPPTYRPAANAAPEVARHLRLGQSLRGSIDVARVRRQGRTDWQAQHSAAVR